MLCDMCGASGNLYNAIVEDAELTVCDKCKRFGNVLSQVTKKEKPSRRIINEPEVMDMVVSDFSKKIRDKRESLNLTQKEFSKKINEKESVIHQLESGTFEPPLDLARKIQRMLKIRLVEEYKEQQEKPQMTKSEALTIGDLIKIKKK